MQVLVDVENKVQESNEENNVIYVNFTVPEACPVIHHFTANVQPDFQACWCRYYHSRSVLIQKPPA
jgi:subtilase family serine protease